MNSKLNLIWLTIVIGSLSGCATMSSDECMASDWSAIGYEDGSRGFATNRFGQHRKACAKHGVTPDFSAYQNGRDQGLVEFCQPHRGFSVGSNIAAETTTEQRVILLADMKNLAERTGKLEAEIKELYDVRARNQVELEHYQLVVADLGY